MSSSNKPGAVLTESQREYLRGNRSLDNAAERNARKAIRDRVRQALLDFVLVHQRLEQRDREQIFEQAERFSESIDDSTTHGIQYMLAFGYLGLKEQGYEKDSVEQILANAIRNAENRRSEENPGLGTVIGVDVDIHISRNYPIGEDIE